MGSRVLGPVRLEVDQREIDLGPARQRCVLAVLLVAGGDAVRTETLVDRVWGDDAPAAVRNSLYSYLARLRGVLRAHGDIDLVRWEELVARARDAAAERRWELLDEAVVLWTGEPLADLTGPWVERTRSR